MTNMRYDNFATARWLIKSKCREATGSMEMNSSQKGSSTGRDKFSGMSTSSHSLLVCIFSTLVILKQWQNLKKI